MLPPYHWVMKSLECVCVCVRLTVDLDLGLPGPGDRLTLGLTAVHSLVLEVQVLQVQQGPSVLRPRPQEH